MIYTSYFGRLKQLSFEIVPVSICVKPPVWYRGLQYKKLAPSYDILMEYKRDPNIERYTRRFQKEILDRLDPEEVVKDLNTLIKSDTHTFEAALMCYEKPTDFCHRQLVAEWLIKNNFEVEELSAALPF